VLQDACVLVPPYLADLLFRLAEAPAVYAPAWSERILDEVYKTQVERLHWPAQLAEYWRTQVGKSFPESIVRGYEAVEPECTNHPEDRHVLAAGIHARAKILVTFNLRDFPEFSLVPHGIRGEHPGTFLSRLWEIDRGAMTVRLLAMCKARGRELPTMLAQFEKTVPQFVRAIRADLDALSSGGR